MINYHKNDLIDECLTRYYRTFMFTLDTADYVPEKYNNKILRYIFKNLKRQFRKLDGEDSKYQRGLLRKARIKASKAKKKARLKAKQAKKNKAKKDNKDNGKS